MNGASNIGNEMERTTNAFTGFGDPIEIKEVEGFTLSDYEKPAYGVIYFVGV